MSIISMSSAWDRFLLLVFGRLNDRWVFVIGTWAVQLLSLWIPVAVFEIARNRGWWKKYRINPRREPDPALRWEAAKSLAKGSLM